MPPQTAFASSSSASSVDTVHGRMSQSSPLRKEVTLLATTWALLLAAAAASTSGLDTAAYSASFCGSGFQSSQSNCVSARAGPATAPALVREYGPAGYGANLLLLADDTLLTLNSDNNICLLTMYPQEQSRLRGRTTCAPTAPGCS